MKRRAFITLMSGAALWPFAAAAQKVPARIGWLSSGSATSAIGVATLAAIKDGMRDNGLVENRDYVIEARYADGIYERFPELARELAQARVAIIVTNTIASVRAAQQLTPPLPIVMAPINDPVRNGLIANLARPGGMTTGVASLNEDLMLKVLDHQRAILPKARNIAFIFNPANPSNVRAINDLRAQAAGMSISPFALKSPQEIDAVFAAIADHKPDALHVLADSGISDVSDRIAAWALAQHLPSFSTNTSYAEFGGLLGYGAARIKNIRKAGYYVKKILDGVPPGELPVEQPTQIELWINMKTAKALGLDIPSNLQQLADQVIE